MLFFSSGQDSFMLIPASFISVNSRSEIYDAFGDMSHYAPADAKSLSVASSSDVPTALIYEMMHCSKTKPLQFRGRVSCLQCFIIFILGVSLFTEYLLHA